MSMHVHAHVTCAPTADAQRATLRATGRRPIALRGLSRASAVVKAKTPEMHVERQAQALTSQHAFLGVLPFPGIIMMPKT